MVLSPRDLIARTIDAERLTEGEHRRLNRDAMIYQLVVKSGWNKDEVAKCFGLDPKTVERRIKLFASLYVET